MQTDAPGLVAFDLDFTLWDAGGLWCDCTTPPYHRNGQGQVFDDAGRQITLYPDVMSILYQLQKLGIPVALASRTEQPGWANELTHLLGMDPFVQYREIYPGRKTRHLSQISADSGVALRDIVFFDDEHRNIHDTQSMGVKAIHVTAGLQWTEFTEATGIPA